MAKSIDVRELWPLLKQTFSEWSEDKAPKMAAALAYYTIISLAPLLVFALAIFVRVMKVAGLDRNGKTPVQRLTEQLSDLAGSDIAKSLQPIIDRAVSQASASSTFIATSISLIVAFFGASGVFGELQDSLNTVWEVKPKPNRPWTAMIFDRFRSLSLVLGVAFLLLSSTVVSGLVTATSSYVIGHTIGTDSFTAKTIGIVLDLLLSTAVVTVMFAAIFKVLPDAKIAWGDVWMGAFVTTILFQIGKWGMTIYFAKASPGSAYGAVGSLVVLLVWIFYSSQILFMGAEFTQVYANKFGAKIVPSELAMPLTEEMRQQAGIGHKPDSASHPANVAMRTSTPPARFVYRTPPQYGKKTHVGLVLPAMAAVVLGRFAVRRALAPKVKPETAVDRWKVAGRKWGKVGRLFVKREPERVRMVYADNDRSAV